MFRLVKGCLFQPRKSSDSSFATRRNKEQWLAGQICVLFYSLTFIIFCLTLINAFSRQCVIICVFGIIQTVMFGLSWNQSTLLEIIWYAKNIRNCLYITTGCLLGYIICYNIFASTSRQLWECFIVLLTFFAHRGEAAVWVELFL